MLYIFLTKKTCDVPATTRSESETLMDTQKLDASIARYKAHMLELRTKRPRVMVVTAAPKAQETAHAEKVKITSDKKCRAKTLEGKQCGFRASCGEFCKKHSIKT